MASSRLEEYSIDEQEQLTTLLEAWQAKKVQIGHIHILYIVDPESMKKIVKMKEKFGRLLQSEGLKPPRKDPYFYVAKLLNPKPEDLAIAYQITQTKKYVLVRDKESIKRELDKRFEIWKNVKNKEAKEYCKEINDTKKCEEFKQKIAMQIEEGRKRYEYLKQNIHKLDVMWTTYPRAKEHLAINIKREPGKPYASIYLRESVPNILQYEPREIKSRSDKEVDKFLQEAINAFGDFYYKEL